MSDDSVKKAIDEIIVSTARGRHSMSDFIKCIIPHKNVESVALNLIFNFKIICEQEGLRVVGEKCIVFDGTKSPSGFTFVLCLDESHISVHTYADEGLLATDLFTCSKNPQAHINALKRIEHIILSFFPDGELYKQQVVGRFLTPFRAPSPNPALESCD
jgi:S-adenosylmethionine/arginine decarboxylase-like enzyme